jgi:cation transport regulator ChaB
MKVEPEVVFPSVLRDMYPAQAQALYAEAYKQSRAKTVAGTSNQMSPEGVAVRDAWEAVGREYEQDPVTHKYRRISDQTAAEPGPTAKRSLISTVKSLFGR